jgi:ligand-binding sensor domain-containing protein/DNA-binding CsgD family transcriptional regulator
MTLSMKKLIKYILSTLVLLLQAHGYVISATIDFMPIVTNYLPSAYSGGMQNWSVTQSASGQIFFGNHKGLLTFDGYQWNRYTLPSHSVVRSVLADGDRIYVGTYTDFGFFERNHLGKYEYTSLWPKEYKAHNDEIWEIIKAPNGHIYFQSFCSWFDYDGQKTVSHYDQNRLPLHFFKVNNRIYVQMVNDGLFLLQGSRYVQLLPRSAYDDDIVGLFALQKDKLLAVTSKNGLYVYQDGKMSRWDTHMDEELRRFQVNKATLLDSSTLVVGTILNGIYALDLKSRQQLWHYNMANRLKNNTVLGLMTDRNNNVWAAMDNGVSVIHSGNPVTVMRTDRLPLPIGMVYGLCEDGNDLYIATNQSLWHYVGDTKEIRQVRNSNGQNWYVASFGEQILAGHNLSTLSVKGDLGSPLPGSTEGSTALKLYQANNQEALIEAGYSGLRLYRKQNNMWRSVGRIQGFQAPILEFEIDNNGSIWAAHFSKGIYKIDLSSDLSKVIQQQYYGAPTKDGIHGQMHVMKIQGRVVFSYQDRLYTYDDLHNRIIPYEGVSASFPQNLISTTTVDNTSLWTADANAFSLFRHDGKHYHRIVCIPYKMFSLEVNTNGVSQYVNGSNTYFFLNNGIGRYQMKDKPQATIKFPLTIAQVSTMKSNNREEFISCESAGNPKILSDNIRIVLSYPNYDSQLLTFRHRLKGGSKDLSSQQDSPIISFNSLGYGNYTVDIEVLSVDGEVLARTTYEFERVVPFYLSIWAFLVYALLCYLVIRHYINWRTKKIIRKNQQKADEELMRQNLKVLEQKQIIAAQQQIIMENELTTKSKELATMALKIAVQKNKSETLRERLLEKKRLGLLTDKDFKDLITKSDAGDSEEVWDIFEQNFDLIHQNFFRNLRNRYPNLTPTDLKFCALLRLNLNTKEIAKNTNLTIRGVEGARYRLRKKLGIKTNQSLTDFLIDIK